MSAPWMLERYAGARGRFKVRKPKSSGRGLGCDSQGEPPDELALRTGGVGTSKALIDDHIEPGRWGPPVAQEAQKAKALWDMKAAKDRREEFYDPAREER